MTRLDLCAAGRRCFLQRLGGWGLMPLLGAPVLHGCAAPDTQRTTTDSGIDAAPGAAAEDLDYRLANRVSWGAHDAEYERVRRLGREGYIREQLQASAGALPAAAQAQIDALRIQRLAPQQLWSEIDSARKAGQDAATESERKAAQQAYQQALNALSREAAHRHLLRTVYSPNQLQEQMQWFWFNHFNVHQYKANLRVLLGDYEEQAIRPHVLGSFRELLGATAKHPAMLYYLDNVVSSAPDADVNNNPDNPVINTRSFGENAARVYGLSVPAHG